MYSCTFIVSFVAATLAAILTFVAVGCGGEEPQIRDNISTEAIDGLELLGALSNREARYPSMRGTFDIRIHALGSATDDTYPKEKLRVKRVFFEWSRSGSLEYELYETAELLVRRDSTTLQIQYAWLPRNFTPVGDIAARHWAVEEIILRHLQPMRSSFLREVPHWIPSRVSVEGHRTSTGLANISAKLGKRIGKGLQEDYAVETTGTLRILHKKQYVDIGSTFLNFSDFRDYFGVHLPRNMEYGVRFAGRTRYSVESEIIQLEAF